MTNLTRQEMEELLLEHEVAELEYNVDRTMATLTPNPHFELCFMGLAVDGWDAVREMYTRMLIKGGEERNLQADARVVMIENNHIVREAVISFNDDNGKRVTGLYSVVVEFDPETKKIKGERMYGDLTYGRFMSRIVGEDITNVPGVTRISESLPVIDVHDAFAAAAARGIEINNPYVKA
ncbi:hypothetical protein [Sphingopyxis sp.]|uniref:hypothetical protein n=1 Tax=Sphingopyxis sp. TaxID=1908224 RepID=UPI0026149055|nr:hypothetical protein [Sphingopyxis sp.]MCW0200089.1 hypothetical protein [Sphingopyxis sp.]